MDIQIAETRTFGEKESFVLVVPAEDINLMTAKKRLDQACGDLLFCFRVRDHASGMVVASPVNPHAYRKEWRNEGLSGIVGIIGSALGGNVRFSADAPSYI